MTVQDVLSPFTAWKNLFRDPVTVRDPLTERPGAARGGAEGRPADVGEGLGGLPGRPGALGSGQGPDRPPRTGGTRGWHRDLILL